MKVDRGALKAGRRGWSADELELLVSLSNEGMSWLQIAAKLGRSYPSVRNMAARKNLASQLPRKRGSRPTWVVKAVTSPTPKEAALSLVRPRRVVGRGFTFSAPEMPLATDLIDLLQWVELASAGSPLTPEDDLDLCERLFRGEPRDETLKRFARKHGISPQDVVQHFVALTSPIRNDRSIPTTDGITRLLALLRGRIPA